VRGVVGGITTRCSPAGKVAMRILKRSRLNRYAVGGLDGRPWDRASMSRSQRRQYRTAVLGVDIDLAGISNAPRRTGGEHGGVLSIRYAGTDGFRLAARFTDSTARSDAVTLK